MDGARREAHRRLPTTEAADTRLPDDHASPTSVPLSLGPSVPQSLRPHPDRKARQEVDGASREADKLPLDVEVLEGEGGGGEDLAGHELCEGVAGDGQLGEGLDAAHKVDAPGGLDPVGAAGGAEPGGHKRNDGGELEMKKRVSASPRTV